MAKIPFGYIHTGTTEVMFSDEVLKSFPFSTPWMPLPPVAKNIEDKVDDMRGTGENLASTMIKLKEAYVKLVDPCAKLDMDQIKKADKVNVEKLINYINQEKVEQALDEISDEIEADTIKIEKEEISLHASVIEFREKKLIKDAVTNGLDETDGTINARETLLTKQNDLAKMKQELEDKIANKDKLVGLKTARRSLNSISNTFNRKMGQFSDIAPYTVNVSLVEKRDSNKLLKFFADTFKKAEPELISAIKAELDPETKKIQEDQEKKEEEASQDKFISLRKNAALAVMKVKGAEIEYRLLKPDASEIERHNAKIKVQTKIYEAADACQKAARESAQPLECAPYLLEY